MCGMVGLRTLKHVQHDLKLATCHAVGEGELVINSRHLTNKLHLLRHGSRALGQERAEGPKHARRDAQRRQTCVVRHMHRQPVRL